MAADRSSAFARAWGVAPVAARFYHGAISGGFFVTAPPGLGN